MVKPSSKMTEWEQSCTIEFNNQEWNLCLQPRLEYSHQEFAADQVWRTTTNSYETVILNCSGIQWDDSKARRQQWGIIWKHLINRSKNEFWTSSNSILVNSTTYLEQEQLIVKPEKLMNIRKDLDNQIVKPTWRRWISLETKASSCTIGCPSSRITSSNWNTP